LKKRARLLRKLFSRILYLHIMLTSCNMDLITNAMKRRVDKINSF
jgi:hypothetical protein